MSEASQPENVLADEGMPATAVAPVAVASEGAPPSWLAVRAGERRVLLAADQVAEVTQCDQIQRVPYVKPWFAGVANLRGVLCGVVDLAAFLDGTVPSRQGASADSRRRVVNLSALLEVKAALLVDEVVGMLPATVFGRADAPQAPAPPFFGPIRTDADGALWQAIDLNALAVDASFLDIRK